MTAGGEHPLADGLFRLSVLTQSAFARVAERHGLPAAQARLLCMLAGGPRGMSELAGLLGIEKAALTGLADRAESRGLIARTAVPGDRRALSVALTPAGRDTAEPRFHATFPLRSATSPRCCRLLNARAVLPQPGPGHRVRAVAGRSAPGRYGLTGTRSLTRYGTRSASSRSRRSAVSRGSWKVAVSPGVTSVWCSMV